MIILFFVDEKEGEEIKPGRGGLLVVKEKRGVYPLNFKKWILDGLGC